MLTTEGLVPHALQSPETGCGATWQVPRVGLALALLAILGLGLALLEQAAPPPRAPPSRLALASGGANGVATFTGARTCASIRA